MISIFDRDERFVIYSLLDQGSLFALRFVCKKFYKELSQKYGKASVTVVNSYVENLKMLDWLMNNFCERNTHILLYYMYLIPNHHSRWMDKLQIEYLYSLHFVEDRINIFTDPLDPTAPRNRMDPGSIKFHFLPETIIMQYVRNRDIDLIRKFIRRIKGPGRYESISRIFLYAVSISHDDVADFLYLAYDIESCFDLGAFPEYKKYKQQRWKQRLINCSIGSLAGVILGSLLFKFTDPEKFYLSGMLFSGVSAFAIATGANYAIDRYRDPFRE